ncbi:hypothetical protein HYPSUDRAFT_209456 [Hypholoma sublateritium FD-334 SS-4]|uniref:Uncharacterized protein n=1 Tax=Hypholoma sublateritium (strain FD-334 SS-4) TaxID=945553 RepID=A0A0D2KGA7_HYPSF|nr:hypothetical protein HYPSUDRAFT_209456 [Hypholoma sublateritium FD-334 SS-4]
MRPRWFTGSVTLPNTVDAAATYSTQRTLCLTPAEASASAISKLFKITGHGSPTHHVPVVYRAAELLGLDLVELSTRNPHPLAKGNPIFVMNFAWEKPSVGIEIVGKHLALVLPLNARGHRQDQIYIFEWRMGVCVASFELRSHTYVGLIFLDETNIVVPNTLNHTLDIYITPPAPIVEPSDPSSSFLSRRLSKVVFWAL